MIKKLARVKNNGWMDGCGWMLWMDVMDGCGVCMDEWMDVMDGCGVCMDEWMDVMDGCGVCMDE